MLYKINEGEFDLPATLHDQTVNVFTITPSGASPFNIVMTRSDPRTGVLEDHVKSELAVMKQAIVGFDVLWERHHQLGARPATIVASSINSPNGNMEQRQVFCLVDDNKSLTITATASPAFEPQHLEWLNALAASFTFSSTA